MAFFNASKDLLFNHFLSAMRMDCMCFLMTIEEEPVWFLSSMMTMIILALCDMMITFNDRKYPVERRCSRQ